MKTIYYGISGQGGGHVARASQVARLLVSEGYRVRCFSYHNAPEKLQKLGFDVTRIAGLRLIYNGKNQLSVIQTLLINLWLVPQMLFSFLHVCMHILRERPALILCDFEPITFYAGKILGVPVVCLDNQGALFAENIKENTWAYWGTKLSVLSLTPTTQNRIVTTFFPLEFTGQGALDLCAPIIDTDLFSDIQDNSFYLLYVNKQIKGLEELLSTFVHEQFVIYGYNIDKVEGNITYKKADYHGFKHDVAQCRGIIANAGFGLISEALYCQKPYLAMPIVGQFEQELNAGQIEHMGYGLASKALTEVQLKTFIENISTYKENLARNTAYEFPHFYDILKKYL
jgi:uncharacterized protein (TIGR00661 family)